MNAENKGCHSHEPKEWSLLN